jgi:hypothetical protein
VDPGAVLLVGDLYSGDLDRLLQLFSGDIGVEAELEEQSLVLKPQLQGLPIERCVHSHPVVSGEQAARHLVMDLRRLVHCVTPSRGPTAPTTGEPDKKKPGYPLAGIPA